MSMPSGDMDEFHELKRLADVIVTAGDTALKTNYRLCTVTGIDVSQLPLKVTVTLDPTSPVPTTGINLPFRSPYHPIIGEYAYVEEYPGRGMVVVGAVADRWHIVGGGGAEPAFAGAWVDYGSSYQDLRFTRRAGNVYIEGSIKNGANVSTVFTLPVGYRPSLNKQIWMRGTGTWSATDTPGLADINTSGAVSCQLAGGVAGTVSAATISGFFGLVN